MRFEIKSNGGRLGMATAALAMAATMAAAQDTKSPTEPSVTTANYGDWVLRCVKPKPEIPQICEIQQIIVAQGQTKPIAELAIGALPDKPKDLVMTALLPVNISFPSIVHVSGNGKTGTEEATPLDLNWSRCINGACAARAPVDDKTLGALRKETDTGLLRFDSASGQTISVLISWIGLDAALKALMSRN